MQAQQAQVQAQQQAQQQYMMMEQARQQQQQAQYYGESSAYGLSCRWCGSSADMLGDPQQQANANAQMHMQAQAQAHAQAAAHAQAMGQQPGQNVSQLYWNCFPIKLITQGYYMNPNQNYQQWFTSVRRGSKEGLRLWKTDLRA
jgi:hypothetical protein